MAQSSTFQLRTYAQCATAEEKAAFIDWIAEQAFQEWPSQSFPTLADRIAYFTRLAETNGHCFAGMFDCAEPDQPEPIAYTAIYPLVTACAVAHMDGTFSQFDLMPEHLLAADTLQKTDYLYFQAQLLAAEHRGSVKHGFAMHQTVVGHVEIMARYASDNAILYAEVTNPALARNLQGHRY